MASPEPPFDPSPPFAMPLCKECHRPYDPDEDAVNNLQYFAPPYDYETGCREYCLACWLGVGPND